MKHLARLVLVAAFMTGAACADYFYVQPTGQIPATLGQDVEVDVWWHKDEDSVWVLGLHITCTYDATELLHSYGELFEPGHEPFLNGFGGILYLEDDDAGNLHFYKLFDDDPIEALGSDILIATLWFEVIQVGPGDGPDFVKLEESPALTHSSTSETLNFQSRPTLCAGMSRSSIHR